MSFRIPLEWESCSLWFMFFLLPNRPFVFASRLEWRSLMTPVLLLFRMGKLVALHCWSGCTSWWCVCWFICCTSLNDALYSVPRFLPPAYSISNRMIAQTPMSPYISHIPTYQVWIFTNTLNNTRSFYTPLFSLGLNMWQVTFDLITDVVTLWCSRCRTRPGCLTKPTLCSTRYEHPLHLSKNVWFAVNICIRLEMPVSERFREDFRGEADAQWQLPHVVFI